MISAQVLDGEVVRNLASGAPVFLVFDVLHDGRRRFLSPTRPPLFTGVTHLIGISETSSHSTAVTLTSDVDDDQSSPCFL